MRTLGTAVLLALAVGAGCKPRPNLPQPAAAIPVSVTDADHNALAAALKERKGKVVLMDFWATWCPPCVKTFPEFVDLHKKYADRGLVCLSVSMDKTWERKKGSYDKDRVLKFLEEKSATFPNFIATERDDELYGRLFGLEHSIPFQVLFGKDGTRVWTREEKELTEAELNKLIESELAK
ncbi:TlpA family protein disulfide reductase [Gemmata sp. G18]|uniref:TlpA family protein disulfide reductase n=1 Tax=Gemmata palustris TaxID=2822762 RepID=A0ABS5BJ37_9BACT|nr:TlpA disulfide reductase family protein [Gemmata palustris]MBP3953716.1 TlpA family protein disulfide reductase [Gemmata palustris]